MARLMQGILFGFLFTACFYFSHQLKDVYIKVPQAVVRGRDAVLQCFFDLEGDKLYSVKWYYRGWEFYRYTPNDNPPIKQFKINGLNVSEQDSKDTQVLLKGVPKDISGLFTCEVTTDEPSFFTDLQNAEMHVIDLPKKDPYITGLKVRYRLGDILKANCTSEESNPAANLTWLVNGMSIDGQHVHKYKPRESPDHKYLTAHSTLRLQITKKLFENGRLKVRCSAGMHNLYHRSSEKSVELEKKRSKSRYNDYYLTTTTMFPYPHWKSEQPAEKPPETTLVFYSPINSYASTSSGSRLWNYVIFLQYFILGCSIYCR